MGGLSSTGPFLAALLAFLAGVVLPFVSPGRSGEWQVRAGKIAAIVGSVLAVAAALPALLGIRMHLSLPGLLPVLGTYEWALDPTSAFFVLLIGGLAVPAALYALGDAKVPHAATRWESACLNLFLLSMVLVAAAADVFSFLLAWELMALTSYFLVMASHDLAEVRQAGYVYLVMTHLGTLFLFAAFLMLAAAGGGLTFDHLRAGAVALPPALRSLLFVFILAGFGTKGGLIPLHIWLPRAHPVAPSHVSALLSGVMVKTAVYGLIRFTFDLLAGGPPWWGGVLMALGSSSAVVGVLYASTEGHLKRLLAFSTVENIGIITMGLGVALWGQSAGRPALAGLALVGTLYHTLNHTAIKGLLFLGAGAVHHATSTLNLEQMGGLIRRMPRTAVWLLLGAAALSALPPLNGFIGEWLLLQSFLQLSAAFPGSAAGIAGLGAAAALALTGALVAATMVKAYGIAFLGLPRSAAAAAAHEVSLPMRTAMGLLALICMALGLGAGMVVKVLAGVAAALAGPGADRVAIWGPAAGPAPAAVVSVYPLAAVLVLAGLGWLVTRLYGRLRWRTGVTWTCGILPDARMQYSSAGYTSPIRLMFRRVLWPSKGVRPTSGTPPLFTHAMEYTGGVHPLYETYLYQPLVRLVLWLAQRLRRLQTGDTQTYLVYLFGTLLLLLLLAR